MIKELFILFISTAFIFFLVSLLTKSKYIFVVIGLNIFFLGILLFSYIQIVGNPIPLNSKIPFWTFQSLALESNVNVKAYYITDDYINLLVSDPITKKIRYVALQNKPEILSKFQEAENNDDGKDGTGIHMKIRSDNHYLLGEMSTFPDDAFQENKNRNKPVQVDGAEIRSITGDGITPPPTNYSGGGAMGLNPSPSHEH